MRSSLTAIDVDAAGRHVAIEQLVDETIENASVDMSLCARELWQGTVAAQVG